jgi:outer membrane lipoprotein-sorting protein
MGEPAVTLAVQKKDGDLVVANVRKKMAKVYPLKVLEQEEAAMGFSFIETGFPRTLEEFENNFTVKEIETKDGIHSVTVTINDRRTSVGLRKMVFYISEDNHDLRGFYLRFRDSSSITTRFSGVKKNPGIAEKEFKLDLEGYETTVHEKK